MAGTAYTKLNRLGGLSRASRRLEYIGSSPLGNRLRPHWRLRRDRSILLPHGPRRLLLLDVGTTAFRRLPGSVYQPDLLQHALHRRPSRRSQYPRVAPIPSLDSPSAAHFAIYDNDHLQKLVLLNTEYFTGNGTSARPSRDFDVASILGPKLRVRRLTGRSSDATTGVTWARQRARQRADGDGNIIGALEIEDVSDGIVSLLASEAVIVERG
ncbi:hypothetical protein BJX61DRAFT_546498 [Aspergillus egyptiacus]|nr:hypothetical protein BJX61DRAFT_546498 [Aspergillus egyptiacus]